MGTIKTKYGSIVAVTITLNGLVSAGLAVSNAIDNSAQLLLDALVSITIADVVEAGNKLIEIFAVSSFDGITYSDSQTGNLPALIPIGELPVNGTGPWVSPVFSTRNAFLGMLPPYWKYVIRNNAGVTLAGAGNSLSYIETFNEIV